MTSPTAFERYSDRERINHWTVALAFVLAALSGLALFHPALFWLSALFGGGPWTRILHPFIGAVMFAAFAFMGLRFWRHNVLSGVDVQWLKHWRDLLNNREERLPEAGRYNAGQKLLFWVLVAAVATLLVTGVIFWRPWFARYFPIALVRLAALLHSLAATALLIAIIVHVYAAFWVKGSFAAMLRGTVSANFAKKHHAAWYRELTKQR